VGCLCVRLYSGVGGSKKETRKSGWEVLSRKKDRESGGVGWEETSVELGKTTRRTE